MTDPLDLQHLLQRAHALIDRLEPLLPTAPTAPDWGASVAFRWRRRGPTARLEPVRLVAPMALADLKEVDDQKQRLVQNTEQFVQGRPANNVLLTGARGTGKSSLIRACLQAYAAQGLRLIEVDKADLVDLPDIADLVAARPERFIVYCDDLSFDEGEAGYKALKSALDGSVAAASDNLLIYATSNRRHLLPEFKKDNLSYRHTEDGEIHPGEVIEEKISLSERFGLWISFYPFSQDEYLAIVAQWLRHFGCDEATVATARQPSLVWALERGSRSGRVAWQFARDWAGRGLLRAPDAPATDVAVGVLVKRDAQGRECAFLLTSRPPGKVYAGYWEYPGGKFEPGETVEQALARELHEELGIRIGPVHPWQQEVFDYPHARVRLHFCKVYDWDGDFEMREGQQMAWCGLPVGVSPVLPGTLPVLRWFARDWGHEGPLTLDHSADASA